MVDVVAELKEALLGLKTYFGFAEVLSPLRDIDKWIRRRLRCYQWKPWGRAGYRDLRRRGSGPRGVEHQQVGTRSVAYQQDAGIDAGIATSYLSDHGAA